MCLVVELMVGLVPVGGAGAWCLVPGAWCALWATRKLVSGGAPSPHAVPPKIHNTSTKFVSFLEIQNSLLSCSGQLIDNDNFYRTQVSLVRSMGLVLSHSLSNYTFVQT